MKKKILSIAACAAMVLSLTACGNNEDPFANLPETSSSRSISTPNNSKPAAPSTPAAPSAPDRTPATSSTPEADTEIDWSTVPYADEMDFVVRDVDGGVTIAEYLGNDAVVNIPPTIDGKKVVTISSINRNYVTHVNIPDGVIGIGERAFSVCSLISVTLPNSITELCKSAFDGCQDLTNVTIPDSVTEIGSATFNICTSLTDVNIPNSVDKIDTNAFYGCVNLTDITIPDSIKTINYGAFDYCEKIKVHYKGKEYDYDHLTRLYSDANGN